MNRSYRLVTLVGALGLGLVSLGTAGCGGNMPGAPGGGGGGGVGGGGGKIGAWSELDLLAGKLGTGDGYVDGVGAAARFSLPQAVQGDGAGNLYVADIGNSAIRKIVVATGAVTTFAGTPGQRGDLDGIGTAAQLDQPTAIAADGAGNLYVTEFTGCIRAIATATAAVTTLAGKCGTTGTADGSGGAARFAQPSGIVYDGVGNLFVTDGSVIRQIALSTGAVTTPFGSVSQFGSVDGVGTAAQFEAPIGITSDGAGNLFVVDSASETVRQIALSTGAVSTLAGTANSVGSADGSGAAARFNYPNGIASDHAGSLYVADLFNHEVRKIVAATGAVTTLAGATDFGSSDGVGKAARFYEPSGITVDAGTIFVADASNDTIRQVLPATGATTTVAGRAGFYGHSDGTGGAARFDHPEGLASDGAGNVYVADTYNQLIRKVTPAGVVSTLAGSVGSRGIADGIGSAATFDWPTSVVADGQGNLYISDLIARSIRKLVLATGAVTTVAGTTSIYVDQDGIGTAASFRTPQSIALDGAGHLFVAETAGKVIRQIDLASAAVTTLAGSSGMRGAVDGVGAAARFEYPYGIASDGAGNLDVSDQGTIRQIVIATGAVTTIAGSSTASGSSDGVGSAARFAFAGSIVSDGAGSLYITDDHLVRKLVLATAAVSTVVGSLAVGAVQTGALPGGLDDPQGLAFLPDGALAISDGTESSILLVR